MSILVLTSDTLAVTPAAGSFEYASPVIVATPIGTQRGIVPTQQYYRLNATVAGADVSTAQSIFNVGCTLSASTVYEFEAVIAISKSAGTTSHTTSLGFGGTATLNNIAYISLINSNTTGFTNSASAEYGAYIGVATATQVIGANTNAAVFSHFVLKGTVSVNAGGTFIPQYTLSAAPGGAYSTQIGSYIRINPLSASGAATNVGTWA
jgi:hypothetical protein